MNSKVLPKSLQDTPFLGRWISFETPGRIAISPGKVELGQGIGTALAQIVAEELGVGIDKVDVHPSDTDISPDEGFTAGSQSVEVSGSSLRLAAAQARAVLTAAAVKISGGDPVTLSCRDGNFLQGSVATGLDFWMVAPDIDWQQHVTGTFPTRAVRDYSLVGTSPPRIDLAAKFSRGGFIHDMVLEGMLHVRVVRQPFRLARLAKVDLTWLAKRYPGISCLQKEDFLALIGRDEYPVHRAHAEAASFVTWQEETGRWEAALAPDGMRIVVGNGEGAVASSNSSWKARYSRGHIAHASIGPSCALAHYRDNRLTVWTHSQGIFALRAQIAACLALDPLDVRVIHVHGSGCYGHNGADDAALDAAIVALDAPGQPVRVQWSREDELGRAPLGAAMSAEIEAQLSVEGTVDTWKMSVVSAPHAQRPGFGGYVNLTSAEAMDSRRLPGKVEDLPQIAGGGASRNAVAIYDFPDQEVRVSLDTSSAVRTSSLRSLGAHLNVFAIESAIDELAEIGGSDPLDFRLRHLTDERCRAVLNGAVEMSGWPVDLPPGEGRAMGLAVARYKNKGAWLAAVADVSVEEEVRVERLWLCVDAGVLINPEGARNQIEGGAIQAVSWTLKEAVPIVGDRVPALDWQSYPILRFSEIPRIETRFIIDASQPPLGAGEAAQGPVAAAIGNAASRALGARMRDLPFTRERLVQILMDG